jgi:starch phosphorylase
MKAALNGVPNPSVLDGWWIEACEEGIASWAIGQPAGGNPERHADELCFKLENTVLSLFFEGRASWIGIMKRAISRIGPFFSSQLMMRRYAGEACLRLDVPMSPVVRTECSGRSLTRDFYRLPVTRL